MTILRTKRLSNPRKVSVRGNSPKRKRKLSPKQIAIFGTKRQKAALKAKRARARNPGNRAIAGYGSTTMNRRRNARGNPKRSPNPALLVTLGPVLNPRRSKATMPKRAKRSMNTKRRRVSSNRRRVARNAHRPRTRVVTRTKVVYRTKSNRRRKARNPRRTVIVQRRRTNRRRRNPDLFGSSLTSKQSLMVIGGGFAGLIATKFIPTLLPTSVLGTVGTSTAGQFVVSLVAALATGWAAGKFVGPAFGNGAMFGGIIQAVSVGLNGFLPNVYSSLGIGLGDLLPGSFTVPQNPIRAGMQPRRIAAPAAAPASTGGQARVTMSGLARAYGNAF